MKRIWLSVHGSFEHVMVELTAVEFEQNATETYIGSIKTANFSLYCVVSLRMAWRSLI